MADTGFNSPGTMATVGRLDDEPWADPDNAKTSNNTYTTNATLKNDLSDYLRATNFTMGVPAGATIDGIEVEVERKTDVGQFPVDDEVFLRKTTTGQVGSNYASATKWPTSDATETYGGAADKWGTTWSAADVNHADFGLDFAFLAEGDDALGSVDHVQIKVYYTAAGPSGTNTQINIGDAWKAISAAQINIGDAWKAVAGMQINIGDTWKTIF